MASIRLDRQTAISLSLSLITAIFLSLESYLELRGLSFCKTEGCQIVGRYLKISESLLITVGAFFFWLLSLIIFFSTRYPKHLKAIPYLVLFPALAFDGAIIGFQIFTIQKPCLLCLSVAASLIIVSGFYFFSHRNTLLVICCILVWLGAFGANALLDVPEPIGSPTEMILFQQTNSAKQDATELTFIFSMNCSHCFEVISYLALYPPANITWKLASPDQDDLSLQKLTEFQMKAVQSKNIFQTLKEVEMAKKLPSFQNLKEVRHRSKKTLTFLANIGFNSVPLLIVHSSDTEERFLSGAKEILNYLKTLSDNGHES